MYVGALRVQRKIFEPPYQKTNNLHIRKQRAADQLCGDREADIRHLGFATWTVQSFFYLNPKCKAPSLLLLLYKLVCV